jgi:uncharacterized membrane protein
MAVAIAAGAVLRFVNLGAREMSADEGASWAAASAPTIPQVLRTQPLLNPGKFALHDILLHGWIRLFGESLAAMRSLSALSGTLAIVAVFFAVREFFAITPQTEAQPAEARPHPGDIVAAATALIFAFNLVSIKYSREARMYPMALLFAVIQAGLFLRTVRRPVAGGAILTALFTTLSIAATFTMLLMLAPEALWLGWSLWRGRITRISAGRVALALSGGLLLLIPPAIIYLEARANAPALTAYAWATPPPFWAPASLFNKGVGTFAFPVMVLLAGWGTIRGWRSQCDAVTFALIWMTVPPLIVLLASYAVRPAFVERYMLASFVPFFALVAFGIWQIPGLAARGALLGLVVALSLAHVHSYDHKAHDTQWAEAAQAASAAIGNRGFVAVAPPYAVNVVRYYLPAARYDGRIFSARDTRPATVAIVGDSGVSATDAARITAIYPSLRMRLRGVMVRAH